jgi:ubiquinone/menaquinone biosynthesis C-methylase UbiE
MDHHFIIVMAPKNRAGQSMKNFLNQALIFYWMRLNHVKLFQRINELDWYKNTLRTWVDNLVMPDNARVMELACATGTLTEYLASNGFDAIGIDASENMIRAARSSASHRAEYRTADAKSLPFENQCVDAVVSASLINIVDEPRKVLAEMVRICKLGGTVSVLVPTQGVSDTQIAELINTRCSSAFSRAVLTTWHQRAPKMRLEDIKNLFNHAGLKSVKERDYLGGMVTSVSGIKN